MIDEKGNEVIYDVLFTFESDETNKNYIVYTNNTKDERGNVEVYASIYDPENPKALDYFIGQVMKKTRGKANPAKTMEMLREELLKYGKED